MLLNEENFTSWSRIIEFNVSTTTNVDFHDQLKTSPRKQNYSRAVKDTCLVDRAILIYLIRSMDESLCAEYSDLANYGTFGLLWDALVARFGIGNPKVLEKLKQQLSLIKLKSANIHDADNFLKKLSDVYQQMKWMLLPRIETDMVTDLLNGIQHFGWYNDFLKCCIILAPSCIEAYKNALLNFIRLGLATSASKYSTRCNTCGKNGHVSKNCYKNNTSKNPKKDNLKQKSVNTASDKSKKTLIASSIDQVRKNAKDSTNVDVVSRVVMKTKTKNNPNILNKLDLNLSSETYTALVASKVGSEASTSWIIDSGAAHSVTYDKSLFLPESLRNVTNQALELGDSSILPVVAIGNIKLNVIVNGVTKTILLDKVKLAPALTFNLLSIPQMVKRGCIVEISNPILTVKHNNIIKFCGHLNKSIGNLWTLTTPSTKTMSAETSKTLKAVMRTTPLKCSLYEWHLNTGHRNHSDLLEMWKKGTASGMEITDVSWPGCEACDLAKGRVEDIPRSSDEIVSSPGTLSGDLMSLPETSEDGYKYVSTFTDTYSRFTMLKLLKSKDAKAVAAHLHEVLKFMTVQTGKPVQKLISDNGLEYDNQFVKKLTVDYGIRHVFTAKYTPSQNGIAERKNRTLADSVRAVLSGSDLDPTFWSHIMISVNHIQNLLGHSALNMKSPYELFYKKKPTVNYLRPLGIKVHVLKDNYITKLESRREPAIFLGYDPDRRGYKVWNLNKNEVQISRNVLFPQSSPSPHLQPLNSSPILFTKRPIYDEHNPDFSKIMSDSVLKKKWSPSIMSELENMKIHDAWELVPHTGQPLLSPKIVLKEKLDENGDHKCFKARIVPKGFQQVQGRDFDDTFAPVAAFSSILFMLKFALNENYLVHHADFDAAFLNTPISHELFMKQIPGFEEGDHSMVYKLKKSIYGLKQSPRDWWLLLKASIGKLGWIQHTAEDCIFSRKIDDKLNFIIIYVDDLLIFAPNLTAITSIKTELSTLFRIKDLGEAKHVLGIKFIRNLTANTLSLNQSVLINRYFAKFGSKIKQTRLPSLSPTTSIRQDDSNKLFTQTEFFTRIGALSHLAQRTRPDILAITGFLASRQHSFNSNDCNLLTRIFNYLKFTESLALTLEGNSSYSIKTYVDADWAGDLENRRSTSGAVVFVGNSPISWFSRRQDTIAMSTTEAELYAATEAVKDSKMIENLFRDLLPEVSIPTPELFCDNQAAVAICESKGNRRKIRHVELRYHFIKEMISNKSIEIKYVNTTSNKADALTKVLPRNKLLQACNYLCLNDTGSLGGAVEDSTSI